MTYLIRLAQVRTSHENNFHGSGAWFHLELPVMATAEDLRQLFEQNCFVHAAAPAATACGHDQMFEAFTAAALPASHGTRNLDERRFRDLGSFG